MAHDVDIAVIGAGPAGLAAAAEAAQAGSTVALIDMNPRLGGQYWRHGAADEAPGAAAPRWHHGWQRYLRLAGAVEDAVAAGRIRRVLQTHVWAADRAGEDFSLHLARIAEATGAGGRQATSTLTAARVIVAAGAHDRHLPIPGWTLPGVMAAGGIQAFIKVQQTAPGRRAVLAGTGPFLLAAAHSVLQAGGEVAAVVETSSLTAWVPGGALGALVPSKGIEGAEYAAAMLRARVPYLMRHAVVRILGDDRARGVVIARVDARGHAIAGTERTYEGIDLVGLGWGFTPQVELLEQLGVRTRLDVDGSLVGVVDRDLRSSVPGVFLAGEVTGVAGAAGAVADGKIAGRAAAGRAPRPADRATRERHQAFARQMHQAHPVPEGWEGWLENDTLVCRCEEVRADEAIAALEDLELRDPRSLKGATRVGMGLCQGRICGLAAQCLSRAAGPEALGHARDVARRPLALPVELGALAGSGDDGTDEGR